MTKCMQFYVLEKSFQVIYTTYEMKNIRKKKKRKSKIANPVQKSIHKKHLKDILTNRFSLPLDMDGTHVIYFQVIFLSQKRPLILINLQAWALSRDLMTWNLPQQP